MRHRRARALIAAVLLSLFAAAAASATVIQDGEVRVTMLSQIAPYKLPRVDTAPISVFVAAHVASTAGGVPPQLKRMDIKVNRHGLLRSEGLPVCRVSQMKTATSQKALQICAPALIGSGRFWAHIALPDQPPYPTHGRLLIFNGREGTTQQVLAHIFTSNPFPSSFVVAFALRRISSGTWGTELSASLPQALGDWSYVDRIKLNLKRKYHYRGKALSYFNAGCPAPPGTTAAAFPLARSAFYFEQRKVLEGNVTKACGVKK